MQMIRLIAFYVLPMLLLAGGYWLWVYYRRNKAVSGGKMIIAVAILLGIGIGAYTLWDREFTPSTKYTPPKLENGKIVPAKMTPVKEEKTAENRT